MWFTIFSLITFIIIDRLKRRPVWTETKKKSGNVGSDRPDRTVNRNTDDASRESNDRRDSSVDDDPDKQDKNMRFESSVNQPVQINAAPNSVQQVTTFQQWNTAALPPKPFEPSMDVGVWVNRFTLYLNTANVKDGKFGALLSNVDDDSARKLVAMIKVDEEDAFEKGINLLKKCHEKKKVSELDTQKRFLDRLQRYDENIHAYAAELMVLAKSAYPESSTETIEKYVMRQFISGIRDNRLREKLIFLEPQPESLEELLRKSENIQKIFKSVEMRQDNNNNNKVNFENNNRNFNDNNNRFQAPYRNMDNRPRWDPNRKWDPFCQKCRRRHPEGACNERKTNENGGANQKGCEVNKKPDLQSSPPAVIHQVTGLKDGKRIEVECSINGEPVKCLLDTG